MFICHLIKIIILRNNSLEKLCTAGGDAPAPGNSAEILLLKMLLVGYNLVGDVHSSKMMFLNMAFDFWEKKKTMWP